jgi:diketogulonate reductase-like aldo/keto reductase
MPIFGLGVFRSAAGGEAQQAVGWAIKHGYVHIDTAALYRNEEDVGKAIKESGIQRDNIFVTTKIWDSEHGYEKTIAAGQESLKKLDIGYIDLLLMHSPGTATVSTWKAIAKLKEQGVCKSIGVSNFGVHHLVELQKATSILPTVNQLEISPYLQRKEITEYCQKNGIVVEGYSPLTKGLKLNDKPLVEIAAK